MFNYYQKNTLDSLLQEKSVTLTSAEVLALNTTPQEVVAAKAGVALIPIALSVGVDFESAAYATNTDLTLEWSGATDAIVISGALDAAVDQVDFELSPTAVASAPIGEALRVTVPAGDPVTGDSPVKVKVWYVEAPLN